MVLQKLSNDIQIPWETNSTQKQCIIIRLLNKNMLFFYYKVNDKIKKKNITMGIASHNFEVKVSLLSLNH